MSCRGFSLLIVLFILFTFVALYPLIYLQSTNSLERSKYLEKAQRINWAVVSEIEYASKAFSLLSAPLPNPFIHSSTFTFSLGDFDMGSFTIAVTLTAIPVDVKNYGFSITSEMTYCDQPFNDFVPQTFSRIGTFPIPITAPAPASPPVLVGILFESRKIIQVTFDKAMGNNVTNKLYYTVSGPGKGSLTNNPTSVNLLAGNTYKLIWTSGGPGYTRGASITITAVPPIADSNGTPIQPGGTSITAITP